MSRYEQSHRELDFSSPTGFGRKVSYQYSFEGEGRDLGASSNDYEDYSEGLN